MRIVPASAALVLPLLAAPAYAGDFWSGWYAGFNLGANVLNSCDTLDQQGESPEFPDATTYLNGLGTGCVLGYGVTGGVGVGANARTGDLVTGFEVDLNTVGGSVTHSGSGVDLSGNLATIDQTTSIPWLATIRTRAGVVINDTTLLYATGGVAIAQVDSSATEDYVSGGGAGSRIGGAAGSGSSIVAGWTAGIGLEMALQNDWSIKAEALYADLGSAGYEAPYDPPFGTFYSDSFTSDTAVGIIRVGLNHRLGGGSSGDTSSDTDTKDWSGAYAGVYASGDFTRAHADAVPIPPNPDVWSTNPDHWDADATGFAGGVTAGANAQMGSLVAGLEVDAGYLAGEASAQSPEGPGITMLTSTGGPDLSLRARLGLAAGKALFYGTAGVITANLNASVQEPYIQPPDEGAIFTSHTGWQAGWIAGGGIEYALADDWSIKAEGLVFDLGTQQVQGNWQNPPTPGDTIPFGWDIHNVGATIRVGLNKGF